MHALFLHSMKLKFLLSLTLPALQSSSRAGEQTIYPLASSDGLVLGLEASGVRETSLLPTVTNSASQTNPREILLAWSAAVGAPFPAQFHVRNSPQAPLPLPFLSPQNKLNVQANFKECFTQSPAKCQWICWKCKLRQSCKRGGLMDCAGGQGKANKS